MTWAAGPFLATGVAIVGAAAIVANPIVPPQSDIRVSPSDLTADGQPIDVLHPDFLQKVGVGGSSWPSPLGLLDDVVSGLITDRTGDEATQSIEEVLGAATPPAGIGRRAGQPIYDLWVPPSRNGSVGENLGLAPALDSAVGNTAPFADLIAGVPTPQQAIADLVDTLATIGSSFGDAGRAFIDQFRLAPDITAGINEAAEIFRGLGERLRELVLLPFALATERGSDRLERLKAFWQRSIEFVRSVIDSLIRLLPAPIRPPDEEIEAVDRGVNKNAARNTETAEPSSLPDLTGTIGKDIRTGLSPGGDRDTPQRQTREEPASGQTDTGTVEVLEDDGATLVIDNTDSTALQPAEPQPRNKSTKPVGVGKATPAESSTQRGIERPNPKNPNDTGPSGDDDD
ncbi:hypothetical protein [Mycolicibacterium thermoresistibile]